MPDGKASLSLETTLFSFGPAVFSQVDEDTGCELDSVSRWAYLILIIIIDHYIFRN